jgi:hypothetical protein
VEEEGAAVEFGSSVRKLVEEPEERGVGALVVLVRVRDRVLGLHSGLSTATVRWRPSRGPGSRGASKRGQRREELGPGQGKRDAWRSTKQ